MFQANLRHLARPCLQNKTLKGWGNSTVVKYLPGIHKALGSNPQYRREREGEKKERFEFLFSFFQP